jgi:hypothetical protein
VQQDLREPRAEAEETKKTQISVAPQVLIAKTRSKTR